jgi:L-ascorbate metabolism protein UlaG (beta-lactamase superfamily)
MKLTWLGHSAFYGNLAGLDLVIDPFWTGNPTFPANFERQLQKIDLILVTHAHTDHLGDTARLARLYGATVVAQYEICEYLGRKGLSKFEPMNTGGTVQIGGCAISMVPAFHSSTLMEGDQVVCVGDPVGFVVAAEGSSLYHAGDTSVFGDMALINKLWRPRIGLLPIGDRFTMGPEGAAYACNELLELQTVVPMHWGTFPLLTGRPETFAPLVRRGRVVVAKPGEALEL